MAKVLIVDDEASVRELLAMLVRMTGHEALTAPDALAALEVLDSVVPELILLDLRMPGMDGWRFLDEIYRRGLRRHTRVVVITGSYGEETERAARQNSVRRVLAKPFAPEEVQRVITEALATAPDELCERADRTASLVDLVADVDLLIASGATKLPDQGTDAAIREPR